MEKSLKQKRLRLLGFYRLNIYNSIAKYHICSNLKIYKSGDRCYFTFAAQLTINPCLFDCDANDLH